MTVADCRPVDVRRIEPELRRLWREQAGARPEGEPLFRVRTLNLVIYAPDTLREAISALLDPLVVEHPARVIAIHPVSGKPPRAWISAAHTHAATGRCIGRELITIECSPEANRELRSLVVPLLVPDLPVFIWWRGRPAFGTELFEDMAREADRIVIDSDELEDPANQLPRISDAITRTRGAFTDLAWARLTPWRQLAAQFFEAPPAAPYLQHLSNVVIEYGGELRSHAVLLAAWLASRLRWRPGVTHRAPLVMELLQNGGRVRIEFKQVASGNGVTAMRLSAPDATFTITRVRDGFVTSSEIRGKALQRRVPQHDEGETEMISRELDLAGHDVLYEQAQALARELLQ